MSMPMPAKATVRERERTERRADLRALDLPPEQEALDDEHRDLEDLDDDDRADLRGEQLAAGERGGAEQLEHAGRALEAGGDGEADHRGRHHGEGEDAGDEEVDRVVEVVRGGQHVDGREEPEQQHRDERT